MIAPRPAAPAGEPAPSADDPLLEIARDALRSHPVSPDCRLTLLSVSENATYAVDDPDTGSRSVLRLHRPGYHSRPEIEAELAWLDAVRADGVLSVPRVLPAGDGALVCTGRDARGTARDAVRFSWLPGSHPEPGDAVSRFASLGRLAARLHRHARQWRAPSGFTRLRWDVETSIGPTGHWGHWQDGLGVGPAERELFGRLADRLRQRLGGFGTGRDRFGLIHADMRLANLLVDGPDLHVIDFDDCGFSWFLYDLAASLSFIEHDPLVPELIACWVAGYREQAPLSAAEEAELASFVLLRRLLLVAWIGSHPDAEAARELGAGFTADSCDLAERYLSAADPGRVLR